MSETDLLASVQNQHIVKTLDLKSSPKILLTKDNLKVERKIIPGYHKTGFDIFVIFRSLSALNLVGKCGQFLVR